MVNKIGISRLHNPEFIQFLTQFLAVLTDCFAGGAAMPSVLQTVKAEAETILADLNLAHKGDPASQMTGAMLEADAERDDYYTGMSQICRATLRHPDSEVGGAAKLLVRSLAVYGTDVTGETQNAETATLNSLLHDWTTKPELVGAAAALNLGAWITALQAANNKFDQLYIQRSKEASDKLPFTMKEKRKEAIDAYGKLVKKINGFYETMEGAAPWDKLSAELNALSDPYKTLVASRQA